VAEDVKIQGLTPNPVRQAQDKRFLTGPGSPFLLGSEPDLAARRGFRGGRSEKWG
jgi:hypothetical protein